MFDFYSAPRIIFGIGKLKTLPDLIGPLGTSLLVVYNGGEASFKRVSDLLAGRSVRLVPYRQNGEPTVTTVDAALNVARQERCTGIIGIGGGSAIDAAKATAGLLAAGGVALDYMEVIGRGQKLTRPAMPWIAIPTTAGTGAEVTRNAVVGDPTLQFKASIRSELLLPRVALIDPELAIDVPPHVTAASGMDALCQCIESYLSSGANDLTDALAIKGVALAARSLAAAFEDGGDLTARSDMALSATISGICLTNAGLGAVHGFAAPIGATYPVPHGVVCAALLPHSMAANTAAVRDDPTHTATLRKLATLGRVLNGDQRLLDDVAPQAAVDFIATLSGRLKIPPLARYGLNKHSITPMVTLAKKASSMKFNPVVLSDAALEEMLRRAIGT